MFDRHYHIQDNRSAVEAARINSLSQEKFAKQLKDISEAEIKSKDRVDITLEEYERLKKDLDMFSTRCKRMESMLERLGIPYYVLDKIAMDSISVSTCDNHMNFMKRFYIQFDAYDQHVYI